MRHDDLVSILMPAFKTDHLREAMESVLNQTHENFELLVGDNSGDPMIRDIITAIDDPRVVHIPSHLVSDRSPRLNHLLLWWRARGRYVRFVYDDDVAYPRSTAVLLDLMKTTPGSAMAWHQRDIIDGRSRILARPDHLGTQDRVLLDRPLLLANLARRMNFIGEPSFAMFDRRVHPDFRFSTYDGIELRFLWDVAMMTEAARQGPIVGTREFLGGFRKHDSQISATAGGSFVFGCVEWEVVFRNELVRGNLAQDDAYATLQRLSGLYAHHEGDVPALGPFRSRLAVDLAHGRVAENTPAFLEAYHALAQQRVH